ncbi:MAG: hypothetical protein EBS56_05545 [Planctomycetia bacterium]|nr:hypothetical protein [Planctomycetia bacterium]
MSGLTWWYPVVAWGVAIAAAARSTSRLVRRPLPRWLPIALGCVALVPVAGMPVGRWLHGLGQTFSIPMLAVLLDVVATPFLGRPWLDAAARRAAVCWGTVAAILLYPAALGLGRFDPYTLGWHQPGVAVAAAALAVALMLARNRFGIVLVAAGVAWQLRLLESENAWDYLVDPVYGLAACGDLLLTACRRGARWAGAVAAARVAAAIAIVAGVAAGELRADEVMPREKLDAAWEGAAAELARRADRGSHAELAAFVRGWRLPDAPDRQRVLVIPEAVATPDFIDTPDEQAIWADFVAARQARAAGLFALALEAARSHAKLPTRAERAQTTARQPLAQRSATAIALLYETLRDDPDHERARKAGGWVKRDGRWLWPETAKRLDAGDVADPVRGWATKSQAARETESRPGRPVAWISNHWKISSQAGPEAAAALARELEIAHDVWRQAFGGFLLEPADLERTFEGRSRPMSHGPFAATLFADRAAYVAELGKLEPTIARTLGLYWTPTRTAYFFPLGEGDDEPGVSTIHHEAVHQLFAEMRKTSPLVGERCGFWAVEAAACYMESLTRTEYGWTLGGRDAGRAPAARERLIDDGLYVPLEELCGLGRGELQADDRLPAIYSQISGLADFFMNGEQERYREAFVEYLVRVYTGSVSPDTLARLCGTSYADLDDAYRRHMAHAITTWVP